jgi:hypothetical protein
MIICQYSEALLEYLIVVAETSPSITHAVNGHHVQTIEKPTRNSEFKCVGPSQKMCMPVIGGGD